MRTRIRRHHALLATTLILATTVSAQHDTMTRVKNPPADLGSLPGDLRLIAVPGPSNLGEFVKNMAAARALGKALFWDMQVGSDGIQSCASCHFRAGADPRSKNQVNPGLKHVPQPDLTYKTAGPNGQLREADFPLTQLATPGARGALAATDSNDVVSSQGIHHPASGRDPLSFVVGTTNTRRVEPRNTPTVINAVFNHRQFWDGRAENEFNGVNHLGRRDPNARVMRADDPRSPQEVRVEFLNSSLASQAVAPIVSELEMAVPGRTQLQVGTELAKMPRKIFKRIQNLRPLGKQQVHRSDSVLGTLSRYPQPGLSIKNYDDMIKAAFFERWWHSSRLISVLPDGSKVIVDRADDDAATEEYSLIQYNFTLFLGLAIQIYEATLVADDTPWDRFRRGNPDLNPWNYAASAKQPEHISLEALFGAHLFNDRTRGATNLRCSNCHEQNELTDASVRRIAAATVNGPVRNRDGNIIDKGFNNIGVRPTDNDLGVGAADAFGPLSHSRRRFPQLPALPFLFDGADVTKGFGVDGAFKIPSLRNVALTAPYFHNGDARTLREVVELYSRGGNVAPITALDGTVIEPLGIPVLTSSEIDALVAFMTALTDERVLYRRAPFDHPQLFVPNGHVGDSSIVADDNLDGLADDVMIEIPAVGAAGGPPLPGFLEGPFSPVP